MEEVKKEEPPKEEKEMERREKKLESRIKNWLKDPYIASLAGILIITLIIRIYYFYITRDQAVWWDGLCYGAIAKSLLTNRWDNVPIIINETSIRPWLMSIVWAGLMKIGITEIGSKFILVFVPSVLTVIVTYFVAEKMYNKRIAIISAFVLAVSWIHVFYSMRLLTHIPGLFVSMVSIYYFFKALEKEKLNFKYFTFAVFFAFASILTRWTYGLAGIVFIFYLFLIEGLGLYLFLAILLAGITKFILGFSLIIALALFLIPLAIGLWFNKKNIKIFNQKSFWIGGILGSTPMILFFIFNLVKYGKLFPAMANYAASAAQKTSFFYGTFGFFSHILQQPFFTLFIIGLVVMAAQLFLGFGLISKVKKLGSHFFILSLLILNVAFLTFYIRYAEDRYMFECFISIILAVAIGLDTIYVYAKKYNKQLAFILVIILLLSGAYFQYTYGNEIIQSRKTSYYQMKQAFLWIKDNTPEDSIILGSAIQPYAIYYADRMPLGHDEIEANRSREFDYVIVHAFTPHTQEYKDFVASIESNLTVVHAEFFDAQQQEPAVIVYKYNK